MTVLRRTKQADPILVVLGLITVMAFILIVAMAWGLKVPTHAPQARRAAKTFELITSQERVLLHQLIERGERPYKTEALHDS